MKDRPWWIPPVLAILTLIWLGALAALVTFAAVLVWGAALDSVRTTPVGPDPRLALTLRWIGITALAGAVVIAIVAAVGRRPVAAAVYGFVAALALVPTVILTHEPARPAPDPNPRYVCQEHSGEGGLSCPGG